MTTKQQVQSKKEQTTMARSVMLTRFKLSQQKEKKEKETTNGNKLEQTPKSISILKERKSSRTNKMPKKCKKDAKIQNEETAELHPNKLKRDKVVKKVVLKPKHKLVFIGRSSGSKRKINDLKDEVKTSTPKRKKTALKNSTLNSSLESNERSQSPVYSELGFEEMIRMADENQKLSDEDLMEILTCPSPVWWEEPLNETFIEGPIILKSVKHIPPPPVVPQRRKHSRKKTPHKVIIEPQPCKEDTKDFIPIIDTKASNNKSKPDYKFNKKRSKLEDLLSTIKNKLNDTKTNIITEKVSEKEPKKIIDERNETTNSKNDTSLEIMDEDTLLPDISPLDSDCLEHLENMMIPIEKKDDLQTESEINPIITEAGLDADENKTNVLNEDNPIKKPFMKIGTPNIKKISSDVTNVKRKRNMPKGTPPMTKKGQQKLMDNKVYNSYTIKNKISPKTRHKLLNQMDRTDLYITDSDDNAKEDSISDQSNEISFTNTKSDFEEYMTVFKIISTDEAKNTESGIEDVKESTTAALKEKIGNEAVAIENESTDKGKLKCYYKICKNTPKALKIIKDAPETEHQTKYTEEKIVGDNEICDDCNVDNVSAIVVHDTGDVKYCLKCSSIFDMDECNYCIRKQKQNQRGKETNASSMERDIEDTKKDSL